MTTLQRYRDFQKRRLMVPVEKIDPKFYEKLDAVETGLRSHLLIKSQCEDFEPVKSADRGRLFAAGELQNPLTMQSYIERGINRSKLLK